ncbi:hypothetical protein FQA39_LY19132 [Lamprigera yunnana]|nr:hypothetical protein FQA39_LY19132 [Lamprigera yunnana]
MTLLTPRYFENPTGLGASCETLAGSWQPASSQRKKTRASASAASPEINGGIYGVRRAASACRRRSPRSTPRTPRARSRSYLTDRGGADLSGGGAVRRFATERSLAHRGAVNDCRRQLGADAGRELNARIVLRASAKRRHDSKDPARRGSTPTVSIDADTLRSCPHFPATAQHRSREVNWFRKGDDGRFLWPGFGEIARDRLGSLRSVEGEVTGRRRDRTSGQRDGELKPRRHRGAPPPTWRSSFSESIPASLARGGRLTEEVLPPNFAIAYPPSAGSARPAPGKSPEGTGSARRSFRSSTTCAAIGNSRPWTVTGADELTPEDARDALRWLIALRVDGLLVAAAQLPADELVRHVERLPIVVAGGSPVSRDHVQALASHGRSDSYPNEKAPSQ